MVNNLTYIPSRGDIVWINLDPVSGHEQSGRRPAIILTNRDYNQALNLAVVCPLTSKFKNRRFVVPFSGKKAHGYILVNHVRTCDWTKRRIEFIETASQEIVNKVAQRVALIVCSE